MSPGMSRWRKAGRHQGAVATVLGAVEALQVAAQDVGHHVAVELGRGERVLVHERVTHELVAEQGQGRAAEHPAPGHRCPPAQRRQFAGQVLDVIEGEVDLGVELARKGDRHRFLRSRASVADGSAACSPATGVMARGGLPRSAPTRTTQPPTARSIALPWSDRAGLRST